MSTSTDLINNKVQDNLAKEVAKDLLQIGAVTLSPNAPYTWASGMRSPIYCDNRMTMSFPAVRNKIANGLAELIKVNYPDCQVIAGTATAGIPHAAWIAKELDLPMIYVRSSAKDHGRGNQIEGLLTSGQKVVMVEDLISTGGSVIDASLAVKEAGGDVQGVVAIFNYQLPKGQKRFEDYHVDLQTLTNYSTLIEVAKDNDAINEDQAKVLTQWKNSPETWFKDYYENK